MGLFMDMIISNNENLKSLLEFDVDDGTENDDEDTNYDSNSDEDDNDSTSTEDTEDGDESEGESNDNTSDDNDGEDGPSNDEDENTDYNVEDTEDSDSDEEGTDEYNVPEESDDNSTEDNNDTEDSDSDGESNDNNDDGPSNDEDENTDYGTDDSGDSDGESDDNDSEDSGGSVDPDRLKQIESELFENLSDSQKAIKIKELKNCFIKLYESCDSILEKLNKSSAPNEDITRIFDYVSNVLNNLKQYVYDYYTDTFDTRSYIENTAQYQKYLTILSTVRNILEEVKCKRPE